MPAPRDNSPASPDADPQAFESGRPAEDASLRPRAPAIARSGSLGGRRGLVLLLVGGVAAAVAVVLITAAVTVPGTHDGTRNTQAGDQASLAAKESAANSRWASATCTNILAWKNDLRRDSKNLNLSFGSLGRIEDAIAATTRVLNELKRLGLPPAVRTPQARAEIEQFRADIESRVHKIEGDVHSVAGGDLAAVGALFSDLTNTKILGTEIGDELRHVLSADLGLSLVETPACRELARIPV